MLAVLVLLLGSAHVPHFGTDGSVAILHPHDSQVHYRSGGGEASFYLNPTCEDPTATVYFSVLVPASTGRPVTLTIEVNNSIIPAMVSPIRINNNTFVLLGCPLAQYAEGFTATRSVTLAEYGPYVCSTLPIQISLSSRGSYALVVGEKERFDGMVMLAMPLTYIRAGVWAGYQCPGTWVLLLLVGLVVMNAYQPVSMREVILAALVLFVVLDVWRHLQLIVHTEKTCLPDHKPAPDVRELAHGGSSGIAITVGLLVMRKLVYLVCTMAVLAAGTELSVDCDCAMWWKLLPVALVLPAHMLGVGMGLLVPIVAVYVCTRANPSKLSL
jgi:hypothetical protein